jgi:hypothetical protein
MNKNMLALLPKLSKKDLKEARAAIEFFIQEKVEVPELGPFELQAFNAMRDALRNLGLKLPRNWLDQPGNTYLKQWNALLSGLEALLVRLQTTLGSPGRGPKGTEGAGHSGYPLASLVIKRIKEIAKAYDCELARRPSACRRVCLLHHRPEHSRHLRVAPLRVAIDRGVVIAVASPISFDRSIDDCLSYCRGDSPRS